MSTIKVPKLTRGQLDHCHDSKKIRGILCGHCNTGLGAFKDDISRLNAAIEYLILADNT